MIDKDNIQDLLREKLQSHEVTPSNAVWENVSSSLSNAAATSGAAATGSSALLKAAVAVIGVSGLGIATYFIVQEEAAVVESTKITSRQVENEQESINEVEKNEIVSDENEVVFNENINEAERENPIDENVAAVVMPVLSEETDDSSVVQNEIQDIPEAQSTSEQSTESSTVSNNPIIGAEEPVIEEEEPAVIEEEIIEEEVAEEQTIIEAEEQISLPNIFTPNNDGANDYFTIEMNDKLDFQIVVIDQTNTVVFQSNSVDFRWDGMLPSGEPAPSGNYVYFLSAKTMSGQDFVKSSKLRIQR